MTCYYRIAVLAILAPLLSCAGAPPHAPQVSQFKVKPASAAPAAPLPATDVDRDTLYDVLLGELAIQRGQMAVAAEALGRAARRTRDAGLTERAAFAALSAKQYDEARRTALLWTELRPSSTEAREALASALLELNQTDEARGQLERVLELERARGNPEQAYMRVAAVLGRAGSRDAALELMRQLVQRHPDVAAGYFALAHLAVRAGDLEGAGAAADRALALKPGWEDAALFKVRILVSQKNAAQAQRYFEEYLKAYPRSTNMRLHYARHLVDQKQWDQARDQFKRVAAETPEDADSIYAVALLALQTNRLEEAETYLMRVLELRPHNDQARIYLGQTLEQNKRFAEAARWYGEVGPGEHYFDARSRLAIVTARQGNVAKARALLQAVPAETDQQRVQLVLAEEQVLRDAKQYHEALKVLNAALMHLPGSPELLYARALVAERLDMLALVENDLRAILAHDPKNVNALNALGYTLADRTERHAEAEALLKRALEQRPDDPFILDSWGWLQYRTGNNAEAIKHLKRALSIRGDAEIAAHLGEVLWVTGDRREAESVWTRALHDEPDSEVLRDVIKKFKP